jgi:hypothetical protein
VGLQIAAGRLGIARDDGRAQDEVGFHGRTAGVVKGENVGGIVFAAVFTVESTAFGFAHDTHRDLPGCTECGTDPTGHEVALEHLAMGPVRHLKRELQAGPHARAFAAS